MENGRAKPPARHRAPDTRAQLWLLAAPFVLVLLAYIGAFGSSGWHPTDYEYVLSQVWRLLDGQVPYRDFIYHKPPGTLLLHTAWFGLPEAWQVRASRLFFYVQMLGATFLPIAWALRRGLVTFGWRLPLLGAAGAVLALHNFPAMPWQTSDGVMFSMIGWVCFLESRLAAAHRLRWRATASFTLAASALCKQSFVVVCVGFAAYALFELAMELRRARRSSAGVAQPVGAFLASVLPAMGLVGAVVAWLAATSALPHFIEQFRSQSTGAALEAYAFNLYREPVYLVTLLAWMPFAGLRLLDGPGVKGWLCRILAIAPAFVIGRWAWSFAKHRFLDIGAILFVVLLGLFLGRLVLRLLTQRLRPAIEPARADPMLALHAGFILVALACQLSLGYNTPILGLFGIGLVLHEVLPEERLVAVDVLPSAVMVGVIAYLFWNLNVGWPYRDLARPQLTEDLGVLFPKLAGIRTSKPTFARYAELKRVVEQHARSKERPFVVLQDYPGVNWLFGTRNPISIDWCYPPEPDGFEPRILAELEASDPIAIVPKEKDAPIGLETTYPPCEGMDFRAHNPVSQAVVQTWRLVGSGNYFCLYRRSG
jgi:hypothetical protein